MRHFKGCFPVKAVFQLRVFHTYVHAQKNVIASNFLIFNIQIEKCMLKRTEKYFCSIYLLSFLLGIIEINLQFYVRVRAYEERLTGKQSLHVFHTQVHVRESLNLFVCYL